METLTRNVGGLGRKADSEEEKKRWAMKYFDFAEAPIKEWIADYLNRDPEEVFDDYKEDSDVLICSNPTTGKRYSVYLMVLEDDDEELPIWTVDEKEFAASDELKRAASMMYEAAMMVYTPVLRVLDTQDQYIRELFPTFDETTHCFEFKLVNTLRDKKKRAINVMLQVKEQLSKLASLPESNMTPEDEAKLNELRTNLANINVQQMAIIDECSSANITQKDEQCATFNRTATNLPKLYMGFKEFTDSDELDEEVVHSRLPQFGLTYTDPEQESSVQQFRREQLAK